MVIAKQVSILEDAYTLLQAMDNANLHVISNGSHSIWDSHETVQELVKATEAMKKHY